MAGCTATKIPLVESHSSPSKYFLENVPYVKQERYYCGPASVEMVLKYHGIQSVDQHIIGQSCDTRANMGTHWDKLAGDINRRGKKLGFAADIHYGDFELLKQYVSSGYPVIVRQWTDYRKTSRHYRVVTGYDDNLKVIQYHDSNSGPKQFMLYDDFADLWIVIRDDMYWTSRNLMIVMGKTGG